VLRTQSIDVEGLKVFLSRLVLTIEAYATGHIVAPPSEQNPGEPTSPHPIQTKDLLHSQQLDSVEEPLLLPRVNDLSDPSGHVYLIWRTSIFIGK
jgi:hypothetical protein